MGRIERKIERAMMRGLVSLLVWVILAPFKLLKWIFSPRKPKRYINSKGYVVLTEYNELEHRYFAIQKMGRSLYENEVVHHINGVKADNAIENLCLMDAEKHEHFHAWLRWKREKSGKYPSISNQKRVLQGEYGGILLDKVESPKPSLNELENSESDVTVLDGGEVDQKRLLEDLKKERLRLAKEGNVPAYLIFHDSTLIEMSQIMPCSEESMRQIRGVGSEKMEKFGQQFICVIKRFKSELEEESA